MAQIEITWHGKVAELALARPEKMNAVSMEMIAEVIAAAEMLAARDDLRAVVLSGQGRAFCAGLDVANFAALAMGDPEALIMPRDHGAANRFQQFSLAWRALPVPVIAALHGAVVGGGLELASSAHIRVADATTFYALPEGTRGIFVGGGGSVRIPKLIGVARMTDMMLTGRVYHAADGERLGFAQYLVPAGNAFDKALELAERIATNAPLTNYALMHALPRIAEQPADHGLLTEALISAIAQSAPEAKERVRDFLAGKAGTKVKKG